MVARILEWFGLTATLIFALPAALLGIELLIRGRMFGGAALVVAAALMIGFERYITTPGDLPGMVAEQTVGRFAKTGDDEDEAS